MIQRSRVRRASATGCAQNPSAPSRARHVPRATRTLPYGSTKAPTRSYSPSAVAPWAAALRSSNSIVKLGAAGAPSTEEGAIVLDDDAAGHGD